jgi:hypothetical protein
MQGLRVGDVAISMILGHSSGVGREREKKSGGISKGVEGSR